MPCRSAARAHSYDAGLCLGIAVTCVSTPAFQISESLAPVLRHITHLDIGFVGINSHECPSPPWASIFCPASTTHTLTHLVTHHCLTSELVVALVPHAPELKHVTVAALGMDLDHSGLEWGVTELCLPRVPFVGQLELLPTCRGGVLDVRTDEVSFVIKSQGVSETN